MIDCPDPEAGPGSGRGGVVGRMTSGEAAGTLTRSPSIRMVSPCMWEPWPQPQSLHATPQVEQLAVAS